MLVYCPGERAEFRALTEAGTDNNLSLYLSLRKKTQTNKQGNHLLLGGGILDKM